MSLILAVLIAMFLILAVLVEFIVVAYGELGQWLKHRR
jgi:hypothetical protein